MGSSCGFLGNPYFNIETPPSSQPTPHARGKGATGATAGGIAAALSFAAVATALIWWQRRKNQDHFFEEDCEGRTGQLTRFSLKELQVATDNFNPENIMGAGEFGKVYKGCLVDGSLVAVKRLKDVRNKVEELQFQTEVEMISMASCSSKSNSLERVFHDTDRKVARLPIHG